MKKFFGAIFGFLKKVLGVVDKVAENIQHYTALALPIVKQIAALTPTRADDEIIALFERFGVSNVNAYLALPKEDRGSALLKVALDQLQKRFPDVPVHQLRLAAELAVTAFYNAPEVEE